MTLFSLFSWHWYLPNPTSITHEWRTRPWRIGAWAIHLYRSKSVTPLLSKYMQTQHSTVPAVQRSAIPPDRLAADAAVQEEYG